MQCPFGNRAVLQQHMTPYELYTSSCRSKRKFQDSSFSSQQCHDAFSSWLWIHVEDGQISLDPPSNCLRCISASYHSVRSAVTD